LSVARLRAALFAAFVLLASGSAFAQPFDHSHKAWDELLKKHVAVLPGAKASQVRYAGFARERAALKAYLDSLSSVSETEFSGWPREQRMAFLINAYNAFTVEKVLTRYPDLKSIRDFGTVFGNPWKDRFFRLFGREASLDGIEHEMLRKPGAYDDPRVHFAVNCASVGCPMLREEAYAGPRLDRQLEEQAVRFLSDRSRNRYANGRLEVSKIFDWFKDDFAGREKFLGRYAQGLADAPDGRAAVAEGRAPLSFLEYDWTLNDAR
jgi:hypothetical protein